MKITVKDAAELLEVSEDTIYRWIRSRSLPAHEMGETYHFNRAELLEWATHNDHKVSPHLFEPAGDASTMPAFSDALERGGILHDVPGATKPEALRAIVERLPLPEDVDRDFLFEIVMAREKSGSTGIGDGIAIPHVRSPIVLFVDEPLVSLSFLASPVAFDAVDGKPVSVVFTLVTPTVRTHLHLLSRLAFLLRTPAFHAAVMARSPADRLLAAAREAEASIS